MLEVGKYYNTKAKNLRATGLTVNKEGKTISRPLYSYWNPCYITLRCEYINGSTIIFREFNTSKLVFGVDDLLNTSTEYETIDNTNYEDIKRQLNEELLWVSKNKVHEVAKETVCNNIEAIKSIEILTKKAEEGIADDLADLLGTSFNTNEPAKIKCLKKGS